GEDENAFTNELLEGQPEPPKYFAMMKKLNKVDRPLLVEVPKHPKLSVDEFMAAYNKGIKIIDTRNKVDYNKGFVRGSLNIQGTNSFATWMGWQMNYKEQFILIADENAFEDLTRKLMRIGMDNIYGFFTSVTELPLELQKADIVSVEEVEQIAKSGDAEVIDVRNESEYKAGHVQGAVDLFYRTIQDVVDKVSKDRELVGYCQAGDRAAIAQSVLHRNGFNVKTFSGSMKEWKAAGKPVVQ